MSLRPAENIKRVMIVHDNSSVRDVLRKIIERGHPKWTTEVHESHQEAERILTENPHHAAAVITSVGNTDEPGIRLIEAATKKAILAGHPLKILVVCGTGQYREKALNAGADDYLVTGGSLENTQSTIERLLKGRS